MLGNAEGLSSTPEEKAAAGSTPNPDPSSEEGAAGILAAAEDVVAAAAASGVVLGPVVEGAVGAAAGTSMERAGRDLVVVEARGAIFEAVPST